MAVVKHYHAFEVGFCGPSRGQAGPPAEEEILRAREHGSPENVTQRGEDTDLVEDNYPKLNDAGLAGVDLSGLELEDAGVKRADLRGAILEGTNLSGASLEDADLTGTTRTRGTDLTGAGMDRAPRGRRPEPGRAQARGPDDPSSKRNVAPNFLQNATYNDATRWPEGFDPREYGALKAEPAPS